MKEDKRDSQNNKKINDEKLEEIVKEKNEEIESFSEENSQKDMNEIDTKVNKKNDSLSRVRKSTEIKDELENKVEIRKSKSAVKNESDKVRKNKINSGDLLEFRAKRLLFYMGYFPTRGVKIRTEIDEIGEDITDLDVYGIYIHKDFRRKTLWVDCKSGAARPLERISWIKGVKQNIDVDDVLFIKNNIRLSVKHFARKSDIQIMDYNILDRIEKNYNIIDDLWLGSWNPEIMRNKLNEFSNLNVPEKEIYKKIGSFISTEYWARDSYTQVKKCITALRELAKVPSDGLSPTNVISLKWGIYELVTLFTKSILDICRELYYFTDNNKKEILIEGLLSNDIPLKRRTEILQASYKLAYEMIKSKVPDYIPPIERHVNIQPPEYFESLLDLINRVIDNPTIYYDILRAMDLLLMEYDLNNKPYNEDEIKTLCFNFDENLVGIKTLIHFICQVTRIPKSYFQII